MALGVMVVVILLQVFFRYVLNDALAWPEEAARFLMMWMTGLIAPTAFRRGGFVAIDMVHTKLPTNLGMILTIILLGLSALVLAVGLKFGWIHTTGFAGNFDSSSLRIPLNWIGFESVKVKLRYMHGALFFGVVMMFVVNAELFIRALLNIIAPNIELPEVQALTIEEGE